MSTFRISPHHLNRAGQVLALLLIGGSIFVWGRIGSIRSEAGAVLKLSEASSATEAAEESSDDSEGDSESEPKAAESSSPTPPAATPRKPPEKYKLPEDVEKAITENPVFGAPPKAPTTVLGVLGDSALINNQWMKVGETKGPVKLIEISGNDIIIEVDGKKQTLKLRQQGIR